MPKTGPDASQWRSRLHQFARGEFTFTRGQRPQRGSHWARELASIESCPRHAARSGVDLFGRAIPCRCGYHEQKSANAVFPLSRASTGTMSGSPAPLTTAHQSSIAISQAELSTAPSLLTASALPVVTSSVSPPHGRVLAMVIRKPDSNLQQQPLPQIKHKSSSLSPCVHGLDTSSTPPLSSGSSHPFTLHQHVTSVDMTSSHSAGISTDTPTCHQVASSTCLPNTNSEQLTTASESGSQLFTLQQAKHLISPHSANARTESSVSLSQAPPSKRVCLYGTSSSALSLSVSSTDSEIVPRRPTDYGLRLPNGWHGNMSPLDAEWIGRTLFSAKGKLVTSLKLWWNPPPVEHRSSTPPHPDSYHCRRLLLWAPRMMWKIDFHCPRCGTTESLQSKGLYHRVRLVLDVKSYYYLAAEYMHCRACLGTFIAWDHRMFAQLADGVRGRFPVLLTHKYACDKSVVALLRSRTLGNSPTALRNTLHEVHSEEWMRGLLDYLTACQRHRQTLKTLHLPVPTYRQPSLPLAFPKPQWFLAAYVRDVWSRMDSLLAAATSTYGSILKMDSTKKVIKKLQGADASTATWLTNVGNERGEILQSVLTTSESLEYLKPLADGLILRYKKAQQPPPQILYTDRDCCAVRFYKLFTEWPDMHVCLDIWHFMRRIALGCTTESHHLYGTFMANLSRCIFQWDDADYTLLCSAKKAALISAGVPSPSDGAVHKAITREELARHCKRRTRGAIETTKLIEELLLSFSSATDTLGVPLLKSEMKDIWNEQKKHIKCIQDIPSVQLYTLTGHIQKGGVTLPVWRCARGSTSLESFHLHLARFVPGTSANAVHFQAYLLEGITRWNVARSEAAIDSPSDPLRSFDSQLKHKVSSLSQSLLGASVLPCYKPPAKYTGEDFGVVYLYQQSGRNLVCKDQDLDNLIDEGFEDFTEDESAPSTSASSTPDSSDPTVAAPPEEDNSDEEELEEDTEKDEAIDSKGIPGWDKVDRLARALLDLSGLSVTNSQAAKIRKLYSELLDFDKRPLTFPLKKFKPTRGRFGRTKQYRAGHVGVEAVKRCFLSAGSPASSPTKSRVVEALCVLLCEKYPHQCREVHRGKATYTSRWKLVLQEYNSVRARLFNSQALLEGTDLMLYSINETTLVKWFKDSVRRNEITLLMQGLSPPQPPLTTASVSLPQAKIRPSSPGPAPLEPHNFPDVEDTTGLANVGMRKDSAATTGTLPLNFTLPGPSGLQIFSSPALGPQPLPVSSGTSANILAALSSSFMPVLSSSGVMVPSSSSFDASTPEPASRTTAWRREREKKMGKSAKPRKTYTCKVCGRPMTSDGHTQFFGQRYCPYEPGQLPQDVWLQQKRQEAAQRKKKGT